MENRNAFHTIAYCIQPLLIYYVVYKLTVWILGLGIQYVANASGASAVWVSTHVGDISALTGALSMAAGFLAIHKTAAQEAPLVWKLSSRADETAAGVLLALSAALFLNLAVTLSGAASSSAGAGAAAAQTVSVSVPLGLLYYGILSPFVEETVFRGITFGRIHAAVRMYDADGTLRPRWDDKVSIAGTEGEENRRFLFFDSEFIVAAVLSSVLFGVYHGNVVQGFYAFCMGLIFCVFMKMTASLSAAALLHGLVNAMTLLLSQSGLYAQMCSGAWMAAFAGVAVCSGGYLFLRRCCNTDA